LLGKYFSAPTGEEQIRWLLGPKTPDSADLLDVQKIGVHDFNASVKLFRYCSSDKQANNLGPKNPSAKNLKHRKLDFNQFLDHSTKLST
jgi:hypothetical protein